MGWQTWEKQGLSQAILFKLANKMGRLSTIGDVFSPVGLFIHGWFWVEISALITLGLLFKVYSLLNIQDFTPQIGVIIHVVGDFFTGMDNCGMVSISYL